MLYAQIINGRVHGVFEYDPLPGFAPSIVMVQCDNTVNQGDLYDGSVFTTPDPVVVDYGTKITKLAMRNRFTFAEKIAIETASETDTEVRVLQKDMDSASYIDLARPDTVAGIGLYESKGLLTSIRATEILTNAVDSIEVP